MLIWGNMHLTDHPDKVHKELDSVAKAEESDAPEFICPCCHHSWMVSQTVRRLIRRELELWDRRYDRTEVIVNQILEFLSEAMEQEDPSSPLYEDSE